MFRAVSRGDDRVSECRRGAGFGGSYCDNLGSGSGKDTLTLGFTGSRLTLGYGVARRGGSAAVFIDGRKVGLVSFDGTTRAPKFGKSRTWKGLGRTRHTVRLVMRDGAGYVDDVAIAGVPRRASTRGPRRGALDAGLDQWLPRGRLAVRRVVPFWDDWTGPGP